MDFWIILQTPFDFSKSINNTFWEYCQAKSPSKLGKADVGKILPDPLFKCCQNSSLIVLSEDFFLISFPLDCFLLVLYKLNPAVRIIH